MNIEKEISFSLKEISQSFFFELSKINDFNQLDQLKSKYLGKKSFLSNKFKEISTCSKNLRINLSIQLNILKKKIISKILQKKKNIKNALINSYSKKSKLDVSLSGRSRELGSFHPISSVIYKIEIFFRNLGFKVLYGQEIEDEFHNFDALNVMKNHPSRSFSDTFWFDKKRLLRTQTSNMQIHALQKYSAPFRIITPGKVYRRDYDSTHTPMFHQIEGLVIEPNVSFSNLKWILSNFLNFMLHKKLKIRFRHSFFPFTIPSAEVDIKTKNNKWLEILGCGMVHPNVLSRFNIDRKKYSAFAFGLGVERLAMLMYEISDIRYFFENDIKFLKQFTSY